MAGELLTRIRDLVLGDPDKVAQFREADAALQAYGEKCDRLGIREETEEYHRLNNRVYELGAAVPPWRR